MTDIVDQATRSRMMSNIRGKNSKPELLLRKALHKLGYRYRLHVRGLQGTPDIVFPKRKVALFVHGCFWHGHDCKYFKLPRTRSEFWKLKMHENQNRDRAALAELCSKGWRTGIVWECALRGKQTAEVKMAVLAVAKWLESRGQQFEIRG